MSKNTGHKGHFVQVWRPVYSGTDFPEVADVYGRKLDKEIYAYPGGGYRGWMGMSRELPRKKAQKYAKAYRNAGIESRVIFRTTGTPTWEPVVTDHYPLRRKDRK